MDKKTLKIVECALIVALSYIGFQFLRVDIPVGTERTAIHLGNTFVVLGSLLLGGWGGFAGAMGLTIADLTSGYVTSAPKTFILKLVIGLLATLVSR
ncbi:MAG: ECF transporter S component, partial [Firmicutes bacterium]|nr:ECF transporter S component [Bacillota bacterium]